MSWTVVDDAATTFSGQTTEGAGFVNASPIGLLLTLTKTEAISVPTGSWTTVAEVDGSWTIETPPTPDWS